MWTGGLGSAWEAIRSAPAPHSCFHPDDGALRSSSRGDSEEAERPSKEVPVLSNSCLSVLSLNISFLWCSSLRQAPTSFSTAPLRPLSGALAACGHGVTSLRRAPRGFQLRAAAGAEPAATAAAVARAAHSPVTRGAARRRGGSAPGEAVIRSAGRRPQLRRSVGSSLSVWIPWVWSQWSRTC